MTDIHKLRDRLLTTFLEVELEQFPKRSAQSANSRNHVVTKLVKEFAVDKVTINTFTNMMQSLNSITIDYFDSSRYKEGNITINLGSETWEIWASRASIYNNITEEFDFDTWTWITKGV